MGKYDGYKCLSCGEVFKDGDDVVVCPDCGTPYHRECWIREGDCINHGLHESGESWKPEKEPKSAAPEGEPVRCSRCGQENPPDGLFCNRCGLPLNLDTLNEHRSFNENAYSRPGSQEGSDPAGQANPFARNAVRFDQDSDIDGVRLGDLARFVGRNQFSFLANFIRFGKFGGRASINFCALLFPQFWFFYRKMNLLGTIYLLGTIALSIPTIMVMSLTGYLPSIPFVTESMVKSANFTMLLNITSSGLMVFQCIAAIFANYWYYKTARKKIQAIRSEAVELSGGETPDDEAVNTRISQAGGVSFPAFLLAVLVSNLLVIGSIFVMNKMG